MSPLVTPLFGAPILEPDVFPKQMYCIEENTCDIVETLRRPEHCAPLLRLRMHVKFSHGAAAYVVGFQLVICSAISVVS